MKPSLAVAWKYAPWRESMKRRAYKLRTANNSSTYSRYLQQVLCLSRRHRGLFRGTLYLWMMFMTCMSLPLQAYEGSTITAMPPDPNLIVVGREPYLAVGDGLADDTTPLQNALDAAANKGAIVMLPTGTYRLTRTLTLPKGVRLIGYGAVRPLLLVVENTWTDPQQRNFVVNYAGQTNLQGNDTFYSAIDNVDIQIQAGNPGTVAIRFDAAQGSYIANCRITLISGHAGVYRLGCEMTNVHILGGDHAVTGGTVSWQTLIMDCIFEGQSQSALSVNQVGPTILRSVFKNVPVAIDVPPGKVDRIYMEDCQFIRISDAAVMFDARLDGRQQLTIIDSSFSSVPTLVKPRNAQPIGGLSDASIYAVDAVRYGVTIDITGTQAAQGFVSGVEGMTPLDTLPQPRTSNIPSIPPVESWRNVAEFGALGDGETDDLPSLEQAVATAKVLYFPAGRYRLSNTLQLRPETILIGLHPRSRQLVLAPNTPGFTQPQHPRPLLQSPHAGVNQVRGLGFDPHLNSGAWAVQWQAGRKSYLGDLWINWTRRGSDGKSQGGGILVDGGGGVFKNLCISQYGAPTGLKIINTRNPGTIYLASVEHKPGVEIIISNVADWSFYALQTEHSQPDIPEEQSLPIHITDAQNILFANLYLYRTSGTKRRPRNGMYLERVNDLEIRGMRNFSLSPHPARYSLEFADHNITLTNDDAVWVSIGHFRPVIDH